MRKVDMMSTYSSRDDMSAGVVVKRKLRASLFTREAPSSKSGADDSTTTKQHSAIEEEAARTAAGAGAGGHHRRKSSVSSKVHNRSKSILAGLVSLDFGFGGNTASARRDSDQEDEEEVKHQQQQHDDDNALEAAAAAGAEVEQKEPSKAAAVSKKIPAGGVQLFPVLIQRDSSSVGGGFTSKSSSQVDESPASHNSGAVRFAAEKSAAAVAAANSAAGWVRDRELMSDEVSESHESARSTSVSMSLSKAASEPPYSAGVSDKPAFRVRIASRTGASSSAVVKKRKEHKSARKGNRARSLFFPGSPVAPAADANKVELKFPEEHAKMSAYQASMLFANVKMSGRISDQKQRNMILASHSRFIKHGRSGAPKLREIQVNTDTGVIFWGSGALGSDSKNKCALIDDLQEIWDGKKSAIFKRETAKFVESELCFSLVFPDRTLDLEALSPKQKELWTEALVQLKLEKALISFDPSLVLSNEGADSPNITGQPE
eukprot:TRINITY_DN1113_c0_g1_i1.p1 TRINITY_DN1113_c0_g1~~TRINITY_DN1113_c0_g1_i1.p1  ORF type:complete len:490 (-),score=135.31 TRINITY_DN1113_c0_g1_i1:97-1566(-)